MNFSSDNVTGVSPEIMTAIAAANEGDAVAYGADEHTQRLQIRLSEVFEKEVAVFPVATGSAANALALSVLTPPFGAIYCHPDSHINVDECGAPEFYAGGAKLVTIAGDEGKIRAADLETVLASAGQGIVHHVQPAAVSITQATEAGTVYYIDEIAAIAQTTHQYGLNLHMDGARFANALVSLGCSPAEMTWKAGVDVLSFGATKNGAMAAEAVIFFNPDLVQSFEYRRKRGGHLFSKMRFLSAQLNAYLTNRLWLNNAAHANRMAAKLAVGLSAIPMVKICYPVAANELFVQMPETMISGVLADGFKFYRWGDEHASVIRLVTAFNTKEDDVDAFLQSVQRHASKAPVLADIHR